MRRRIRYMAIIAIIAIITIFASSMYINQNIQISKLSENKENLGAVTLDSQTIQTNPPVIVADGFSIDGSQIVANASDLLGKRYLWSGKGGGYDNKADPNVEGVDCSGLVAYALNKSEYVIRGLGIEEKYNVPLDCDHWLTYKSGNSQYMKEVGLWSRPDRNSQYTFNSANPTGKSTSEVFTNEVTCNKSNNGKINVLKVNDIIGDDYRYYEYYDSDGTKKLLPMGTIIVSWSGTGNTEGHAWICIGDLGTSNADEAIKILKDRYNIEVSKDHVKAEGNCTYWRIESSGAAGVTINNGNPNYLYAETANGITKKIGSIWAFQIANASTDVEGKYHLNLVKKDLDNDESTVSDANGYGEALSGAEFTIKQYINTVPDSTKTKDGEDYGNWTNIVKPFRTEPDGKSAQKVEFNGSSEVDIDDIKNCDYYRIKETKAPNGYTIKGGTIQLTVHKKQNGNKYELEKVVVTWGENKAEITPGGQAAVIQMKDDGSTTNDKNAHKTDKEYYLAVDMSKTAITVTWRDPNITRNPKLKVEKKDLSGKGLPKDIARTGRISVKVLDSNSKTIFNKEVPFEDVVDLGELKNGEEYVVYIKETKAPEGYINEIGDRWLAGTVEVRDGNLNLKNEGIVLETEENGIPILNNKKTDYYEPKIKLDEKTQTMTFTVKDPQITGNFNLDLIKYVKGTTIPLAGAEFKVSVKDEKGKELADINKIYITGNDGHFTEKVSGINIEGENKKYTITVTETKVPEGYEGIVGSIVYKDVESYKTTDGKYALKTKESSTVQNAKKVTVTEGQVLIEAENTPEGPHKGVKEVYNQDSGYYDEVTGKVYKDKETLESTLHDWVITSKIPSGIDKYAKYIITDPIDERLKFTGLESVKVSLLDGKTLAKTKDLIKDTDYQVNYDEKTSTLKVSFIEGSFTGGRSLPAGSIVEIRFNTTFEKDKDGNIIAINQSVENKATLTYGDNSGNEVSKDTEKPEVHTGGVGLYKYDKNTGKALEGAKFKIATSKENAENGIFVKDANGKDIEKVTNEKGIAVFEGLEFGEDAMDEVKYQTGENIYGKPVYKYDWGKVETTYYVVETEAPTGYTKIEEPIEAVVKKDNYDLNNIETLIKVGNESSIYDLTLRKFITAVKDGGSGEEKEVTTRIPNVDITPLVDGTNTTANYNHPKDPVLVHTTDIVTYTLRIFNEGPQDACAAKIMDDIPEGLEFLPEHSTNIEYKWKMYKVYISDNPTDIKGITSDSITYNGKVYNPTNDASEADLIITDYLDGHVIDGFNPDTMSELDYEDVKVAFKVVEPTTSDRILINYAQISEETDRNGNKVTDRDSTPNEWKGEDDEDIEKVRVLYFDLALRKWVTQAIVTENGQTYVTETGHKAEDNPEEVVKVDLKKSKLNQVTVKFRYSIRVTNEGEIAGEATEVRDDIPNGLKFVAEDNPDWREEDGKIVTDKLAGTTLQPGESAEVEILLTWINDANNMGVMVNTAEISKDHNEYGTPDIDSTPGNYVPGEDDIDDAPVMLTVKTGSEIIMYITLALGTVSIIGIGVIVIKRNVLN